MPTIIGTSMLSSSPPSHMPAWKVFPLELSCPKVGTRVEKVEGGGGEGEKRKRLRSKPKNSLFSPSSPFLFSGQLSRHNSSETRATQASFDAETGLSVLSGESSNV